MGAGYLLWGVLHNSYHMNVPNATLDSLAGTKPGEICSTRDIVAELSDELAKYGFVLFAAAYMSENMGEMQTFKGMLPVLLSGGVICLLIIIEPNMSVTMCVGMLILAMLFLGGMQIKHFMVLFVPVLAAVPLLIIAEPYRISRLSAFLHAHRYRS